MKPKYQFTANTFTPKGKQKPKVSSLGNSITRTLLLSPTKFTLPRRFQSPQHFQQNKSDCNTPKPRLEFSGNLIQNRTRTKTEVVKNKKPQGSNNQIQKLNIRRENSKEYIVSVSVSVSDRVTSSIGSQLQDDFENAEEKINKTNSYTFSSRNSKKEKPQEKKRRKLNIEERGLCLTKSRKNSEDIEFNVKLKQIMTQPISQSIFANKQIIEELKSPVSKSFKIELNQMLKDSKDRGTVHEEKIGGVLTFNNKPKTRKVSYQEAVINGNKNARFSYAKHCDNEMAGRAKRNSLKFDNIA